MLAEVLLRRRMLHSLISVMVVRLAGLPLAQTAVRAQRALPLAGAVAAAVRVAIRLHRAQAGRVRAAQSA
jgi:hypothetical protein